MLSCEKVARLVSLKQEQKLTLGQNMQLKMHLWMCKHCYNFDKNVGALRELMRAHADGNDESNKID